jgi:L-asparagine oxygenase
MSNGQESKMSYEPFIKNEYENREHDNYPQRIEINLTPKEHSLMRRIYTSICHNPYSEEDKFIQAVNLISTRIARRIWTRMMDFKVNSKSSGIMIIKNLPTDEDLPPTPSDTVSENYTVRTTFFCETSLTLFALLLGEPYSFFQENCGNLYQNVVATKRGKNAMSSESSSVILPFHTEDSFHPYSPDYVCLACLKEDPLKLAKTIYIHVDDIFRSSLLKSQKDILFESRFINKVAYSFGYGNNAVLKKPTAVCWGDPSSPFIRYSFLMKGTDSESQDALKALKNSFKSDLQQSVELKKGEVMILNNRKVLHGRTKYKPDINYPNNRWLKRIFIINNLSIAGDDILPDQHRIRTNIENLIEYCQKL